jgi:hypothetical protein
MAVFRCAACLGAAMIAGACGLGIVGEPAGSGSGSSGSSGTSDGSSGSSGTSGTSGTVADGAADGAPGDDGGSSSGATDSGPYATRVKNDLVALYEMEEGSGSVLHDTSGFGTPLPATFASATDVAWVKGGVTALNDNLASTGSATKVALAAKATNEVSVEVWARFTSTTLASYARLITFSTTGDDYNIAVTSEQTSFWFYLSTSGGATGGESIVSPSGVMHFVGTYKSGAKSYYVNGAFSQTLAQTGTLSSWVNSHPLSFFNSQAKDRPMFPGELHLVAFYSRALSASEIAQNFAAGPDP